jgi:nucleolar protein 56
MKAVELFKNKDINGLIRFYKENKEREALSVESLVPSAFKTIEEYKKFMHEFTIQFSVQGVREGLSVDDLISVYVSFLDSIDGLINDWFERVFELFTLYYPEASIKAKDLESFNKIKKLDKKSLSRLFKVDSDSMGMEFKKEDVKILEHTINTLKDLIDKKKGFEKRTEKLVTDRALNTSKLAGSIVAARLIAAAGSLKRLMLMPSSTIQVIGSEKALFRHLRSKAKPPKHGIIFHSHFVSTAPPKHRGKMARALASKISIAAKVDYYKGELIWKKLVKDLENKLGGLK